MMPLPVARARAGSAGFTLVEVLVALALFALIGVAGFSMLDQVLRTQRQTEARLDRLAEVQRAMYLISLDFSTALGRSVSYAAGSGRLELRRAAPEAAEGAVRLQYDLADGVLVRSVAGSFGPVQARQPLLAGVTGAGWQFFDTGIGWGEVWPPPGQVVQADGEGSPNPAAIALTLTLAGREGQIRRVALLPAEVR